MEVEYEIAFESRVGTPGAVRRKDEAAVRTFLREAIRARAGNFEITKIERTDVTGHFIVRDTGEVRV